MSVLQRGHFKTESSAAVGIPAAAPQCGQCLLPKNINPKQAGHATVASFDSQYLHCDESELIAAPQLGQLRVWASILCVAQPAAARHFQLNIPTVNGERKNAGLRNGIVRCSRFKSHASVSFFRHLSGGMYDRLPSLSPRIMRPASGLSFY
jgi:hypothetical protein